MYEVVPDSQNLARAYCPLCEPEADPSREVLDPRPCDAHQQRGGLDDDMVVSQTYLSGSADAGGDGNRRICDLIHRGVEPKAA